MTSKSSKHFAVHKMLFLINMASLIIDITITTLKIASITQFKLYPITLLFTCKYILYTLSNTIVSLYCVLTVTNYGSSLLLFDYTELV